jgi:RNA polymerase sigma-70 factor, ECF subfamily
MTKEALAAMIQGCRKDNCLNQKELYKYFFHYGMNVCSRYARSDAEAEEMMNDAFLRIFTKMDLYGLEKIFYLLGLVSAIGTLCSKWK